MRVFFAIWPNDSLRERLVEIQQPIRGGRKLVAANLHLTLHYIGEVTEVDCLLEKAGRISFRSVAFTLDQYGVFRQARVLWAGPEVWPEELSGLAADCRQVAADCGFSPKGDRFRPHVTLARKIRSLPALPEFKMLSWRYSHFVLVESVSTPQGVVYKRLGQFGV